MRKGVFANVFAGVVLVGALGYYNFVDKAVVSGAKKGNRCPDFTAQTYTTDGDTFLLSGDTFVVLSFSALEICAKILLVAKAALQAPARNCDVGTVEEQKERFKKFCTENTDNHDIDGWLCGKDCPLYNYHGDCESSWLLMPYKETN